MKIKVDKTGLQGRAVNPNDRELDYSTWFRFEINASIFPLTEKATPNSVVDAELVWQHKRWQEEQWYPNKEIHIGLETRQAYQVSGVKEDEPKSGIAIKKRIEVPFLKLVKTHTGIWEAYKFIHGKTPYDTNKPSSITQDKWWDYCNHLEHQGFMPLKTLESGSGTQNADFGDYLMKGISGEVYPCKPDIFALTYDII